MDKEAFKEIDDIIEKEFDDIVNLSKTDTKVNTWYDSGVYALNYICSKNLFGAYPKGRVIGISGKSGTGKSLLAATMMRDERIDLVFVVETEGGGNAEELLAFAGVDKNKVRRIHCSTYNSYKITKKTRKIEEISDGKLPQKKETDQYIYVEGLSSIVRRLVHTFRYNKKLQDKNVVIILDSLGNMQSVRGIEGNHDMGKRGQDLTNFFRNFDNEFEKSGLTFIFTNKVYQSMDGFGGYVQTGGESPIFNSSLYLMLSDASMTTHDEVSGKEQDEEKNRRSTALGAAIKTLRAKVLKSRFGTDQRQIPFLLDFSVGPVRLSGLFTLLNDFGIIKKSGGAYYELLEIWEKKFMKKDFSSMVLEDEENLLNKFQKLLEKREEEIKKERLEIQVNDIEEVENDDEMFTDASASDLAKEMEKDMRKK